jgi:hypothetical protein
MTTVARRTTEVEVDLVGTVTMARVIRPRLTLRLADGREISAPFALADTGIVTEALRDHATRRLRLRGQGRTAPDGSVARILRTEEVTLVASSTTTAESGRLPLWQIIEEIGTSVPPDEWAKVPADASINLDHYLYGSPKK